MKSEPPAPGPQMLHYFLGSNTPQGFVSRFDQLIPTHSDGWRCFIIKGGPGSGKSTLMRKVAAYLQSQGHSLEIIHCSSDVDSLDGVICPALKLSIADGTAPHVLEPKYPGAVESLIDITACWDTDDLFAHRAHIIALSQKVSRCHELCCRYLGAAAALSGDTYRLALDCLNHKKLTDYATRLCEKELKPIKNRSEAQPGHEHIRVLSAVTNKGAFVFAENLPHLCRRLYLLQDNDGAVSRVLLRRLRDYALTAGHDIISCYCPLSPFEKLEYLFVPSLSLGFVTANRFHNFPAQASPYRIINSRRFTDLDKWRPHRQRVSFNHKAVKQMITQAEALLAEAKTLHDQLEEPYIHATDFDKVNTLSEAVLAKIRRLEP